MAETKVAMVFVPASVVQAIIDDARDVKDAADDLIASLTKLLPQPVAPADRFLVVLDPGHGGRSSGAVSPLSKLEEDDYTLAICKQIVERAAGDPAVEFVLTRDALGPTEECTLEQRADFANKLMAAGRKVTFVSVHLDSNTERNGTGWTVFHWTAARPESSIRLAKCLHDAFAVELDWENVPLRDRGVRSANYFVLRETSMPAVLIECGFIGTETEAVLITKPFIQATFADGIIAGVRQYLNLT